MFRRTAQKRFAELPCRIPHSAALCTGGGSVGSGKLSLQTADRNAIKQCDQTIIDNWPTSAPIWIHTPSTLKNVLCFLRAYLLVSHETAQNNRTVCQDCRLNQSNPAAHFVPTRDLRSHSQSHSVTGQTSLASPGLYARQRMCEPGKRSRCSKKTGICCQEFRKSTAWGV